MSSDLYQNILYLSRWSKHREQHFRTTPIQQNIMYHHSIETISLAGGNIYN